MPERSNKIKDWLKANGLSEDFSNCIASMHFDDYAHDCEDHEEDMCDEQHCGGIYLRFDRLPSKNYFNCEAEEKVIAFLKALQDLYDPKNIG